MGNSKSSSDISELGKYRTLSVFRKAVEILKGAPPVNETAVDSVAEGYFQTREDPSSTETWRTCLFVASVLEMTVEDPENADVYVRGIKRVLERRMDKECFPYRVVDAYVDYIKELNSEPRPL